MFEELLRCSQADCKSGGSFNAYLSRSYRIWRSRTAHMNSRGNSRTDWLHVIRHAISFSAYSSLNLIALFSTVFSCSIFSFLPIFVADLTQILCTDVVFLSKPKFCIPSSQYGGTSSPKWESTPKMQQLHRGAVVVVQQCRRHVWVFLHLALSLWSSDPKSETRESKLNAVFSSSTEETSSSIPDASQSSFFKADALDLAQKK